MRGIVIVEGRDELEGPIHLLLAHYHDKVKGLIEVPVLPEQDDLFAQWLLQGIVTCTGVPMVLATPYMARISNEQLEEVCMIGEDTKVFRITLTPAQMVMMRYHFNIIDSGVAAGMMQKLPLSVGNPGEQQTVLGGNFIPIRRFLSPERLARVLGDELAEIVLRLHA